MNDFSGKKTVGIFVVPANKKIIAKLKEQNFGVIEFAYRDFIKNDFAENELNLIEDLKQFGWLVFTNIYAVDFFLEELEKNGVELFELDDLRVCSFGEAVADRLRFAQLHSDIIAQKINENAIADAILEYQTETEDLKILVVKTQNEEHSITKLLREKNIKTDEITVAEMNDLKTNDFVKLKSLLKGGAFDEFIFGSVDDVAQFKYQFPEEFFNQEIFETIFGTDEITLKTLDEFGIKAFYIQK